MAKGNGKITDSDKTRGYLEEVGYDPDSVHTGKSLRSPRKDGKKKVKTNIDKTGGKISSRTIVFIVGIVILLISSGIALINAEPGKADDIPDKAEYRLFKAVLSSSELNYRYGPGSHYFDAGKLASVTAEALVGSLVSDNGEFENLELLLEVLDVSRYPADYSRSISKNTAIATSPIPEDESLFTIFETAVSIHVTDDEVHSAKLIMYVWN